jgi:predicted ABC-type exoprotein transport system permease subunit
MRVIKIYLRLVLPVILLMIFMTANRMKSVGDAIIVFIVGVNITLTIAKKQNLTSKTDMPC